MPDFNAQNTDAAQTFNPSAKSRDNDLKVNGRSGVQDVASDDPRDTQTGKRPAAPPVISNGRKKS